MKENDEYKTIVKLVGEYAVNNPNVSFSLRKAGTSMCDVKTEKNSTTKTVIGKIYTNAVMNALKEYEMKNELPPFEMKVNLSDSSYQIKKNTFILFVNKRCVDHVAMKKIIERLYEEYLPKLNYFVYIDMTVDHDRIDVNVNPSKSAIRLLEEEKILGEIEKFIKEIVKEFGQERSFQQTQLHRDYSMNSMGKEKKEFGMFSNQNSMNVFRDRIDSNNTSILQYTNDENKRVIQRLQSDKSILNSKLKDGEKLGLQDEEVIGGSQMKPRKSIQLVSPFKIERKATIMKQKEGNENEMEEDEIENNENNINTNMNMNENNDMNSNMNINNNQNGFINANQFMEEEYQQSNHSNQLNQNEYDEMKYENELHENTKQIKQPKSIQQSTLKFQKTLAKRPEINNQNEEENEDDEMKKQPMKPLQIRSIKDIEKSPNSESKYSNSLSQSHSINQNNQLQTINTIEKTSDGKDIISIHVVKRRPSKFIGNSLQSIKTLRHEFEIQNVNIEMIEILSKCSLVGVINSSHCLIQSNTQLYLLHIPLLLHDLFYQQIIYSFGDFTAISLSPSLSISYILQSANISDENEIERILTTLKSHSKLLFTYFNISITENGELVSLPDILPGYLPSSSGIAFFLLQLSKIDWKNELQCFRMISDCLANYYCILSNEIDIQKVMESILIPYIKNTLIPQKYYDQSCLIQIADISKLYHLFERC